MSVYDMSVYERMRWVLQRMTADERMWAFRHEMQHQLSDLNACVALLGAPTPLDEQGMELVVTTLRRVAVDIKGTVDALVESSSSAAQRSDSLDDGARDQQ